MSELHVFSARASKDLKISKVQFEEVVEVQWPQNAYQFPFCWWASKPQFGLSSTLYISIYLAEYILYRFILDFIDI